MKKSAFVVTLALSLWGCANANTSRQLTAAHELPLWELTNEKYQAERSRMGAPTVYNGEATGGAGYSVTTKDGQVWAPEEAPGNTVLRTQGDVQDSLRRRQGADLNFNGRSQVMDEGKTDKASR